MDKWKKIYAVAAGLLCLSVIGMIVSEENKELFWAFPAILSAITCIFARLRMRRKE